MPGAERTPSDAITSGRLTARSHSRVNSTGDVWTRLGFDRNRWRVLSLTLTLAAVTLLVGLASVGVRIPNPPAIMVLVIVASAFLGGLGPGLVSAAISWVYIAIFFSVPDRPFSYTDENLARVVVWAVSMPAMAALVGTLRARTNALAETLAHRERELARESTEDLRALIRAAPVAISALDLAGNVRLWNPGAERIFGWTRDEVVGRPLPIVPEDLTEDFATQLAEVRGGALLANLATELIRNDGRRIHVSVSIGPTWAGDGHVAGIMIVGVDDTTRHELEAQLAQAARMEAIGQLAGGIAHDFNNLLTALGGNAEFLRDDLASDDPRRDRAEEILEATKRATALTQQLLAFSRRQIMQPIPVRIGDVVRGIEPFLRRLIAEDIDLVIRLDADSGTILADRTQLEQVLLNLAINARDAMPVGGTITIEASNVNLDGAYAEHHIDVVPGPHVLLAVSDTGVGMDAGTRERIFEPFFTTKAVGEGTGLGLATVYGIVKQSGGHIWVYSEPGKGTTFKTYFPRVATTAATVPASPPREVRRGQETILLIEDDAAVRAFMTIALERLGYTILGAQSGNEALRMADGQAIDLLISDIVMPGMPVADLVAQFRVRYEKLRVLYISGYTEDTIVNRGVLEPDVAFLGKPFSTEMLGRKVREVLEAGRET